MASYTIIDSDMEVSEEDEVQFVGQVEGDTRLATILNDSQDVTFDTDNGIRMCREIILHTSKEKISQLIEQFCNYLEELLVIKTSAHSNVNTVIEFLIQLLANLNRHPLEIQVKNQVILHALSHFRANSDDVRLRVCEIVHKYLQALNSQTAPCAAVDVNNNNEEEEEEEACDELGKLDEKLFVKMRECLIERMRDTNSNVQIEAISAASFLQSPDDSYCPIINAYMFLLRSDSYTLMRVVILDNIALNNTTFGFLKDELVHDTNPEVRHKVIKVILKKISNKFISARLRRKLAETLIADDKTSLLKDLVFKWLAKSGKNSNQLIPGAQDRLGILHLIRDLSLASVWFQDELANSHVFKEQKLFRLMTAVLDQEPITENIAEFNDTSAGLLFESLEAAFHLKSLVCYCYQSNQLARFNRQSVVQANVFYFDVIDKLCFEDEISASVDLHFYQLFEASYYLDMSNFEDKIVHLATFVLSSSIKCHKPDLLIYQAVMTKLSDPRTRFEILKLVWNYYSLDREDDPEQVKKCLGILSVCMAQLTRQEYAMSLRDRLTDLKDNLDHEDEPLETMPKFLFKKLLLRTIQSQDPDVRAMTVRVMGTFTLLDSSFVETSFPIFFNAMAHDYPQVVIETQKLLFNICLTYPPEILKAHKEVVQTTLKVLQMQMDCLDQTVKFVAYEGFAKLLINKSIKNEDLLFKIFLTYVTLDQEKQSKLTPDQKELKSCLGTFLNFYFRKNPSQLVKMVEEFVNYGLEKKVSLKACTNYAAYLTSTRERPQIKFEIMNSLLDMIIPNIGDFRLTQRLTIALLEFRVYDSEIEEADSSSNKESDEFYKILNQIATKLQKLTTLYKAQKWKLPQEQELREVAKSVTRLNDRCVKAKSGLKRTRPISMISIADSNSSDQSCTIIDEGGEPDVYQFQTARAVSKPKASKRH